MKTMHKLTLSAHTQEPVDVEQYQAAEPLTIFKHDEIPLVFFTPSHKALWRVDSFYTKEPDTVAWLEEFNKGEVLLDIGANMGLYTIFAAKIRGVRVYAFEPESQNYAILNRNIYYNQLCDLVHALPVAISNERKWDVLHLSKFEQAGSCHNFGEALDPFERKIQSPFRQASFSDSTDALIAAGVMPVPNYIKIDVDGIEPKVVDGMKNTLDDKTVKSVLIEINSLLPSHQLIMELMKAKGFGFSEEQVKSAQRTEGIFKGVGNVIFRR